VLGKNLEHPHLTRQFSDMGQVRWKMHTLYNVQFQPLCHLRTKTY